MRVYGEDIQLNPCSRCRSNKIGSIDYSYAFQFECLACGHLGPTDNGLGVAEAGNRWNRQNPSTGWEASP